tara:strand:+ start:74 stop:256 length:183 start_codon:yes stop_codon:yes gene_type:complete
MKKELILVRENNKWVNVNNGHTNYGLDGAMKEIFTETQQRMFYMEDNKVFLISDKRIKLS